MHIYYCTSTLDFDKTHIQIDEVMTCGFLSMFELKRINPIDGFEMHDHTLLSPQPIELGTIITNSLLRDTSPTIKTKK